MSTLKHNKICKIEIKTRFNTAGERVGKKVGLEVMVFRLSRLEHPFMLYKEFFGDIMRWLKKTSRRGKGAD